MAKEMSNLKRIKEKEVIATGIVDVSIVCHTYNHEKYIRQAIDSFLSQFVSFNVEILVHDDASTDGTVTIIKEYENKYPNLIKPIYQHQNQYSLGINNCSEYQFPRAKGKYIAICDGDDYWIDDYKLLKQYDLMQKNIDATLCYHSVLIQYENSDKKIPSLFKEETTLKYILTNGCAATASSVFFRNYFKGVVPNWCKNIMCDWILQIICAEDGRLLGMRDIMGVYRRNVDSLSVLTGNAKKAIGFFEDINKMCCAISSHFDGRYDRELSIYKANYVNLNLSILYHETNRPIKAFLNAVSCLRHMKPDMIKNKSLFRLLLVFVPFSSMIIKIVRSIKRSFGEPKKS